MNGRPPSDTIPGAVVIPVLKELVILLAVSVVVILISNRIKLPPVVGFLLTGVLIGPGGFAVVKNSEMIDVLAEIGVVMLLFMIGLEFNLESLKRIQRSFWLGGGLQVFLTTLVSVSALAALGVPAKDAVFFGFLVSLSSTAVVLRILSDRGESAAPQGQVALGILLFQDMAIVPMIALVPVLASARSTLLAAIASRFLLSAATIAAVFVAARFLMPRVLHLVVRTRIREVFLIASLFFCLGMAWLTSSFGSSLALGAFLAGIIISESVYSHQVVSEILPFKDVFNSLFFISIGMMLDTSVVWGSRSIVVLLVLSILVVKSAVVVLTIRILGHAPRVAVLAGLALAQVGEFSFVLAGVGRANGLLPGEAFQVFLASSILTILATPFLIQIAPAIAERSEKAFGQAAKRPIPDGPASVPLQGHVVIAGYGLNGRNLAKVLREAGIGYVILELNPETVRNAAAEGEPIIFGDASSPTILREVGIEAAHVMVIAISDPATARRGVRAAREMNRDLFIIVRTRYASEVDGLIALGADDVVPEEFKTSIEIFTRCLDRLHVPPNLIDAQVKILRSEGYGILRGTCQAFRPAAERITDLLSAGTAETFYVMKGTWPAGRTLKTIALRERTGATVLAVVRGEESFTSPGGEFTVEAGDTLILVANHKDMDGAFHYLKTGRN